MSLAISITINASSIVSTSLGHRSWLLDIVDYYRPDLLISLGDWGEAIIEEEFYDLLKRVRVQSIYGNYENLSVLKSLCNLNGELVLMSDDEVRVFNGIRLGAINGIAALRRREKKGIPRKRPEEFIEYGKRLSGKVDVLLLHGSSWIEEYIGMVARNERTAAVAIAIYETIPKLVFCGHLPPYTIHRFDFGTTYICIDISQKHKCYCYAILSIKQYGGRGMERS